MESSGNLTPLKFFAGALVIDHSTTQFIYPYHFDIEHQKKQTGTNCTSGKNHNKGFRTGSMKEMKRFVVNAIMADQSGYPA